MKKPYLSNIVMVGLSGFEPESIAPEATRIAKLPHSPVRNGSEYATRINIIPFFVLDRMELEISFNDFWEFDLGFYFFPDICNNGS